MERQSPSRPLEWPEVLFTFLFFPIAAFSGAGMLLAEFGAFTGARVVAGAAVLSVLFFILAATDVRRAGLRPVSPPRLTWLVLVLTMTLAAGLFSRPGEYLIEGADGSLYLGTGRNIARTGGIIDDDPIVALMPRDLRTSFFTLPSHTFVDENRLPGGLRTGPDGKVHPSFFHLYPVWVAIATSIVGDTAGYYVNVLFAVLSIGVVSLIGTRVWSPIAGGVAALLLAVNFGQIFQAQSTSAEILTQFFVLSGMFFSVLAWDLRLRITGACAAAAIGLAAFARIDAALLLVPLTALWLLFAKRKGALGAAWTRYVVVLAAVAGHATVHAVTVARFYTARTLADGWTFVAGIPIGLTLLLLVGGLVAIGIVALMKSRGYRLSRPVLTWPVLTGLVAAGLLAVATLKLPVIVISSRILTPVGLGAAFAALVLLIHRRMGLREVVAVGPFIASFGLLLAWRAITMLPEDFRRMVPTILPGAMLLVGFLVAHLLSSGHRYSRVVWLLPAALAAVFLVNALPFQRTPAMRGVHQQILAIASQIPPDALVVTDRSVPGHLALALQYSFGRRAVRLDERPPDEAPLTPLLARVLASGRPVVVAVAPLFVGRTDALRRSDFADFDIRALAEMPLRYSVIDRVRGVFPSELRTDDLRIALYEVKARDRDTKVLLPLNIDIGGDDFTPVVRGFHFPEVFQSATTRWTTEEAHVALPRLAQPADGGLALVLRLSAGRPQGLPPARVRVAIDGIPAGLLTETSSDLREYTITLPAAVHARLVAGPTMMTIMADVFVPKAAGIGDDDRPLGIVLDWIRIE